MTEVFEFTPRERDEAAAAAERLTTLAAEHLSGEDRRRIRQFVEQALADTGLQRDIFGVNPVVHALETACLAVEETGLGRDGLFATLLYMRVQEGRAEAAQVGAEYGESVARIIGGLCRIHELYKRDPVIESENFRGLLLSFAEDMRVILIMIADRVVMMRRIRDAADDEARRRMSQEAAYLYAPLAHKLGLYRLKTELEDLSLKYLEHDAYYMIREKLSATKRSRDAYIEHFIGPVAERLQEAGLRFHIKGRTKSIHSIWQKMKKQKCGFEGIYDLFAIRIILSAPEQREKMQCWQAYSIVTDMYQPNPKRLRDWLSVPKSNGYESLHITVLGPEKKWVEVQIRTERMDEVAEHGLAAHWRYKGVRAGGGTDAWLAGIRAALEAGGGVEVMDQFRLDLYEDEVYVFSPKGDLFKFPKGATVLDFAYYIHTGVGNACVGGRINGRQVPIRETLHSGDTVEILTQSGHRPNPGWLNIVKTAKAKAKIRLSIKETQAKEGLMAKEMLERRLKNRKIEMEETVLNQLVKRVGYKELSDFYRDLAEGKTDVATVIDKYIEVRDALRGQSAERQAQSAEDFSYTAPADDKTATGDDVLVIDRGLKGIDYSLAACCRPIYGDDVFGFVTISGGIKIHRADCPNAPELRRRFGYRIVRAKWSGKGTSQYSITLRVVGHDDIGIVSNITNIISKEEKIVMRSINIDTSDGLFTGNLVVMLEDTSRLAGLVKKLRTVRGVRSVNRV